MNAIEFINWLKTFEHFTNDAQYEHIRPDYKFIAAAFEHLEGRNAKTFLDAMHYPHFELREDMTRIYKDNWKQTMQFLSFAMTATDKSLYPRAQYEESQVILAKLSEDTKAARNRHYANKKLAHARYDANYALAVKFCEYTGNATNARRAFVKSQKALLNTLRQNLNNELLEIDADESAEIAFLSKNAFAKTERLTEDTYVIIQNWIMKNFA